MNEKQVELVTRAGFRMHGLAMVARDGSVWLTFARPWWDLAAWFWYWLTPGERKWTLLRRGDGSRVRVRASRVSEQHIMVGESAE